jgi:hypothetical protein
LPVPGCPEGPFISSWVRFGRRPSRSHANGALIISYQNRSPRACAHGGVPRRTPTEAWNIETSQAQAALLRRAAANQCKLEIIKPSSRIPFVCPPSLLTTKPYCYIYIYI